MISHLSLGKRIVLSLSCCFILFIVVGVMAGRLYAKNDTYKYLHNFNDTLDHIKKNYVDAVEMTDVVEGAWIGLLESLDPYCAYVGRDRAKSFEGGSQSFASEEVGLVLSKRHGYCVVVATMKGSPAEIAKIESGDYVRYIGDLSTRRLSLYDALNLLNGPPGKDVTVKVLKARNYETEEIVLTRTKAAAPELSSEILPGGYGLLRIPAFSTNTSLSAKNHLENLIQKGCKGIIVDLRGNAVGNLVESVKTVNLFLDSADLFRIRGKTRLKRVVAHLDLLDPYVEPEEDQAIYSILIRSSKGDLSQGLPLVVMVDQSTADAAEVFAAAIKDHERGVVMGRKTFGKGSMQDMIQLNNGSGVILSIAKFYRLNGEPIQEKGINPSVEVKETGAAVEGAGEETDPFLSKAIELLEEKSQPQKKAA